MIKNLHNLALFWVKTPIFAIFFCENIFKIITSVPGHPVVQCHILRYRRLCWAKEPVGRFSSTSAEVGFEFESLSSGSGRLLAASIYILLHIFACYLPCNILRCVQINCIFFCYIKYYI
jgi:hypothetical protein